VGLNNDAVQRKVLPLYIALWPMNKLVDLSDVKKEKLLSIDANEGVMDS